MNWRRKATNLDRLHGGGVEVLVGISSNEDAKSSASNTWSLPINLISHHSMFFKAACSWNFQESRKKQVELPEDDPAVFGLFVEWMYYGSYDVSSLRAQSSIDAQCWVLGDKLLCSEFKNYAMSRLYALHTASFFARPVTCDDVQYVCDNSGPSSKLRQFYTDFVLEYFGAPSKLCGTIEDWDTVLQNCSDIRVLLLRNFRHGLSMQLHLEEVEDYLESDESHLEQILKRDKRVAELAFREMNDEGAKD